jgi:hypothetical protein
MVHECHRSVDPSSRLLVDQRGPRLAQPGELGGQVGHAKGQVMHALASTVEESADRGVVGQRRQQLHTASLSEQKAQRLDPLVLDALARFDAGAEQPLVARMSDLDVAHGDADVVNTERGHARIVPRAPPGGSSDAIMQRHVLPTGGEMGLFDKVREKATDALEQGKEAAQTQQLKLQLRKLEGELEQAHAAFGAAAFDLWEAGTLSTSSDLGALATRVREARAAIEAKKTEISSASGAADSAS